MRGCAIVVATLLVVAGPGQAATYTVTRTADTGWGSLRWAIEQANAHEGSDVIQFSSGMTGQVIRPSTPLPALSDEETTINGDTAGDGRPHVALNGIQLTEGDGIRVLADLCGIRGLAIYNFPGSGILLDRVWDCRVSSCYVGTDLTGRSARPNGTSGIRVWQSHHNTIGGRVPQDLNVIAAVRQGDWKTYGIYLAGSQDNIITANAIGLTSGGFSAFTGQDTGVYVGRGGGTGISSGNHIGSPDPDRGNSFAGLRCGVLLTGGSHHNVVCHCAFGLGLDGDTEVPMSASGYGVYLAQGASANLIGGDTPAARNLFAGGLACGILAQDAGTEGNIIQGNYFGTNYAGDAQRSLSRGVILGTGAGAHIVGGDGAAAGNYFASKALSDFTCGVGLSGGGSGTTVQHNVFGRLPNGAPVTSPADCAICVTEASATVRDNRILNSDHGVCVGGASGAVRAFGNRFGGCRVAALATDAARLVLGNLGNTSTSDDGGNVFYPNNGTAIDNRTSSTVKAEGNDFRTTSRAEIEARIWDRLDDPSCGRVDYDPLKDGEHPTEAGPQVVVVNAMATPTSRGAEIAFALSAGGIVTIDILNPAGRPVAIVVPAAERGPGLHRIAWSGRSIHGSPVPAGTYLVRIAVEAESGHHTTAVCPLMLR